MNQRSPSVDELGVTVAFVSEHVVVGVHGEVDMVTAPTLGGLLSALVDRGHTNLVLDFADLDFLDCAGLRVIACTSARLQPSGSLSIRSLPAITRRILEITGVDELVHIEPTDVTGRPSGSSVPSPPMWSLRRPAGGEQAVAEGQDLLEEARRNVRLSHTELWCRYFGLGGMSSELEVEAYLYGALEASPHDRDLIAVALNERLTELGGDHPVPYSDGETSGGAATRAGGSTG